MTTLADGLDADEIRTLVRVALDEDLRYGPDVTSAATVPDGAVAKASVVSRSAGVVAGVDVGLLVLDEVVGAGNYEVLARLDDGAAVEPGTVVLTVSAPTRDLLTAERTMLNLMCHLSGIATATALWVGEVAGTDCKIRDRTVGRRGRGHRLQDPRQPQDAAGTARTAEVRGPDGRRRQPPHGSR